MSENITALIEEAGDIWETEDMYPDQMIPRLVKALDAEHKRAEALAKNQLYWIGDAMDVAGERDRYRDLARRSELQCQEAERDCLEAEAERDMLKTELRYGAAAMRDATDEWEVTGNAEKLVIQAIDPWISRVHEILSRGEAS